MDECRCGCGQPVAVHVHQLALACYQRWRYHGYPDVIPPPQWGRPGRIEDYVELRSSGLSRRQAAERLGVTVRTVWRYEQALTS